MIRACGRRGRGRQVRRRRNQGDPPSEGGYRGCRPLIELWKQLRRFSFFNACCDGVEEEGSSSDSDNESAAASRPEAAAAPAKAAGLSINAPPFVPAADRVPASASFETMRPAAAASSASKPPPPPLKTKSSLRASAKEWEPNPAAPEWKPASFSSMASPAIAPTVLTGAGVGGGAPHHMGAVSPHLMGGAPLGPVLPQQYPQPIYRAASMGHHAQQHPRAMVMDMEEGVCGGGLHAWGGNSPHDHGGNREWDMAARAAGVLEEVDSPAQPRRPQNTGAEAGAEWAR